MDGSEESRPEEGSNGEGVKGRCELGEGVEAGLGGCGRGAAENMVKVFPESGT